MEISFIEQITKSNTEEQNFLLRYYARIDTDLKQKILLKHRKILYDLRKKNSEQSIEKISYSSLILAIKITYAELNRLATKKFDDMKIDDMKNITLLDIQSFKNKKHYKKRKKDKLLQYWGVVKLMKNEGVGFRDIADYLGKKYRFKVGYSTIYEVWKKIE